MEKPQLLVSGLQVTDQNKIPSLYQAQTKEFTYINQHIESFRSHSGKTAILSLSLFYWCIQQIQGVTINTKMILPLSKSQFLISNGRGGFSGVIKDREVKK